MAQRCLICGSSIDGDETFYQHHLNQCLDKNSTTIRVGPLSSAPPQSAAPQSEVAADAWVDRSLSPPEPDIFEPPRPQTARSTSGKENWLGHDNGKHHIDGSKGLVQVMGKLLEKSHEAGHTRLAYLCNPAVEHVARGLVDMTWGCGYRNAQMLFTCLRELDCYASIHPTASGSATPVPTILEFQTIIEHAWAAGHDPDGARHFKHKLRRSIRWVGTVEMYTAFTWLGIRATIVDFPKAKKASARPAHDRLLYWLKDYFEYGPPRPSTSNSIFESPSSARSSSDDDFSSPVQRTTRQPVYLQHAGHSRTVVGIESGPAGHWLLLFDPGKNVDAKVRRAGERAAGVQGGVEGGGRKRARSGSSVGAGADEDGGTKRKGFGQGLGKAAAGSDEEDGLATAKYAKLLDPFRVSIKKLGKHDEYQIMYVEDGPVLTDQEKKARRFVKSVDVSE